VVAEQAAEERAGSGLALEERGAMPSLQQAQND
jgi:hypothetical protein